MSLIGSFIGMFTGDSKAVDKGLDMLGRGVDMAIFTKEEKSIANQKKLDWTLDLVKAMGPQNIARRFIAFGIVGTWLVHVYLATILYLLDKTKEAQFVYNILKDVLGWPFITIIGFYFLAHAMRVKK